MREGASDAFRREINRANSPVIPFVELLRTEREAIVDTGTEWGEADSLTGITRRAGQIILTGSSNTFVEHTTGTDETLTDLVNPIGAAAVSVAAVQWGSANAREREIHAVTARLDPATGAQNVATWKMGLYRLFSVERNGERSTSVRWHLQPIGSPVSVTAGSVQADVTFALPTPALVGDAPIIDPDVSGAPIGDVPTVPTTVIAIWAVQSDGSPATNVAWVTDDADDEKTISGNTVGRYDLDQPTGGSYAGLAFRNTGPTNGVPRFALIGRTYSPVTVTFTSNPIDLGAAPGGGSTVELIGQGRARGGSILYEIHDGSGWVEYVDGDHVGVDRSAVGGSDLSAVTPAQTYDMRVTLTPATVGASPIVARIGAREIGQSEYVTENVIIGGATWAVDPITGASEVPEIEVTFPIDGRRDFRSLIEDTLATYHVGALQLRIWMGDPSKYRSEWLHIDDFLVNDYATVDGGLSVTAVSPLALTKREIPEATGATITPLTYLADTPADVYDDLIASQLGVPARFIGEGIDATTPLLSREIDQIVQGRDALAHVARIGRAAVISSQGRLKAVPFFGDNSPDDDDLTLFTLEETRVVAFSPGYRTRVTSAVVKYAWDNADRAFSGSRRAENTDAINNIGRGAIDFEEQIDEELCRWLSGPSEAQDLADEYVNLFGPGMKLVRLQSSVRRPWLEPGTPIAVESDQFVGRDPVTGVGVRGPMIAYATVQAVNDVEGTDVTAWIRSWEDIVPSETAQTVSGFNLDLSASTRLEAVPIVYGSARGYVFDLHYSLGSDVTYVDMTASSATLIVGGVIFDLLVALTGTGTLRLDFGGVGTGPSGALFYSATSSGSLTVGLTPLSDSSRTHQGDTVFDRTGALSERGQGTRLELTSGGVALGDYAVAGSNIFVDADSNGRPQINSRSSTFHVASYGIIDGTAAQFTAALIAADAAAAAVGGGYVAIPSGSFEINAEVEVSRGVTIIGAGSRATSISHSANGVGFNLHGDGTDIVHSARHIRGIRLEGNSGASAIGIDMGDTYRSSLVDVLVYDYTGGIGIRLGNDDQWTEGTVFDNVHVRNCAVDIQFDASGAGTNSFAETRFTAVGVVASAAGQVCVELTGGAFVYGSTLNIKGNLEGTSTSVFIKTNSTDDRIDGSLLALYVESSVAAGVAVDLAADSWIKGTGRFDIDSSLTKTFDADSGFTLDGNPIVYTPATLAASVTSFVPRDATTIRATGASGGTSVHGIAMTTAAHGRRIRFVNLGSDAITFVNQSGTETTAERRLIVPVTTVLGINEVCDLEYDTISGRWRVMGSYT